jgi:hypothetical protein
MFCLLKAPSFCQSERNLRGLNLESREDVGGPCTQVHSVEPLSGKVWVSIVVQQEHFLGPLTLPPLLNSAAQTGHNVTVGVAVHYRALRKPVNEKYSLCVPKDRCQLFSTCQCWLGLFWRRTVVRSPLHGLLCLLRHGIAEPRLITSHQTSKYCAG